VRTLHLTHPFMHGADVHALQVALATNKYGDFYMFAKDGVYGPVTANRVAAAKWHIGYSTFEPVAGDAFMRFLLGTRPLTGKMWERRKRREGERPAPHPQDTLGQKALHWALSRVGEHENPPGSNRCFATDAWGHGPMAWCNIFVSLAYIHAGSRNFDAHQEIWQLVPAMLHAANTHQHGLHRIGFSELQPGDIIVHGPGAYHTTLHDRIVSVGARIEWDVGGNEGSRGYVLHDIHDASLADAFIRVEG